MDDLNELVFTAVSDFQKAALLANAQLSPDLITVEIAARPHKSPRALPAGKMAVYAFFLNGQAIKVGKAGPKTAARYTSQHYNPASAKSNLAKSILTDPAKVGFVGSDPSLIGDWIKQHTDRVNLLLPATIDSCLLSLLEAFLHVRWKPVFEGRVESPNGLLDERSSFD